jgi:acetate---CoA ligase (ADP-forming)
MSGREEELMLDSAGEPGVGHAGVATGLKRLFAPRTIAVVGASQDTERVGGEIIANLLGGGYRGRIVPVNPKYGDVLGQRAYPTLRAAQGDIDVAVVAVAADRVVDVVEECGAAGVPYAVVLSSGFGEVGDRGKRLQRQLDSVIARTGVRVVGPNCIGFLDVANRVYCGFGPGFRNYKLKRGPAAMVSQSGGYAFSVVGLCDHQGLGFSKVYSTGNECDLSTADLIDYLLDEDDVEVIVCYIEGVRHGRALVDVGRKALARGKPILCWKVGNSAQARSAAASHTANLSAPYEIYQSAFEQTGFIEIREIEDLVDIARGFLGRRLPRGRNVGIVTTSGGSGVLMADRCSEAGLALPPPGPGLVDRIAALLPPHSAISNPVDLTAQVGDNGPLFNAVVRAYLEDPDFDQVIVRYGAVQSAGGPGWAAELAALAQQQDKPLLVAWSRAPDFSLPALQTLEKHRIPWFVTPGRAVCAAAALHRFAQAKRTVGAIATKTEVQPRFPTVAWPSRGVLSEKEAKAVVSRWGIAVPREIALTAEEMHELQTLPFDFPVVVKVDSRDLPHKTEAGGVRTGIASLLQLKQAAVEVVAAARAYKPDAHIDGVTVQQTCSGLELIAGGFVDPHFGPVVVVGMGGIYAEVFHDVVRRLAPVTRDEARCMLEALKAAPLLRGYRGMPPRDMAAMVEVIYNLGHALDQYSGEVREIDFNPVFLGAQGQGAVAADALIVLYENASSTA